MIEWMEKLKVGDPIFFCGSGYYSKTVVRKVERITPTTIIVQGNKFSKKTERHITGDRWRVCSIYEYNEEDAKKYEAEEKERVLRGDCLLFIRETEWKSLKTQVLQEIASLIKAAKENQDETNSNG